MTFWQTLTKRQQISLGMAGAVFVIGLLSFGIYYKNKLMHASEIPNTITNQATLTYTDSQGQTQTVLSNTINIIKQTVDTTPPTAPQFSVLKAAIGGNFVKGGWDASTDNVGVAKYIVYRDSKKIAEVLATDSLIFSDQFVRFDGSLAPRISGMPTPPPFLLAPTTPIYGIQAVDAANNVSTVTTKTIGPFRFDKFPPDYINISGITVTKVDSTHYTLKWTTSAPAYGQVAYGPTTNLGYMTTPEPSLNTDHSVNLTLNQPLGTNEYYYFNISALNFSGKNGTGSLGFSRITGFDANGQLNIYSGPKAV